MGGKNLTDYHYKPTVMLNPPADSHLSQEEVFGPVLCLYSYEDMESAIVQANRLPTAFQASVFTQDLSTMLKLAQELRGTAIMVNDHTAFRADWMPFGGQSQSGLGMGGIPYTLKEVTQEKMVVIHSDMLP